MSSIDYFTWEIEMVSPLLDPVVHDLRPVNDGETVWYEVQGRYEPVIEILTQEGIEVEDMPYRKVLKFIRDVARVWIEENTTSKSYLVEVRRGKIDAAFADPNDAVAFKMRFG
jgi:hypothetical protein